MNVIKVVMIRATFVVGVQDLNPRQGIARCLRPWLTPWDAENWRGFFSSDHLRNKLLPFAIRMTIWFAAVAIMAIGRALYRS